MCQYIYTPKQIRFEFVFFRVLKKLLRRKFIKAKVRFFKPKFWFFLLPNYTLTQKSKNSRMGAGVGKFIRLCSFVNPGKTLVKTWRYTPLFLQTILKYLQYKIPYKLLLKYVTNKKKDYTIESKLYSSISVKK